MKKNRYIPFGYHIQNGALCIHEAEAIVVRQVFEDYQSGTSYRRIAENLTGKGVLYMENRTDWNKHMVKRMLENPRYCGRDNFPIIVPADTFGAVTSLIGQKSQGEPLSEELDSIRSKAICGACGAKYKRDGRSKNYEAWCCSAEGRITPKRITDKALLESITDILNEIIRNPSLLELPSPHRENYSLDVARTENQINRELEKSEVDSDYTKLLIFGCAAAKYEACADTEPEYLTRRLLAIFEQQPPLDAFSVGLFEDAVKQVVQLQSTSLTETMTAKEAMRLFCAWHRVPYRRDLLERFDMAGEYLNKQYSALSTGRKRRLHLALALCHNPKVLILDEPTAGLDVEGRYALHEEIKRLKTSGVSILIATHDMAEAEKLCDTISILREGAIVRQGNPRELTASANIQSRIIIKTQTGSLKDYSANGMTAFDALEDDYLSFACQNASELLLLLLTHVKNNNDAVVDLRVERASIEDLFLSVAGGN